MIVTVTPNPSIDRTVTLATPLTRGAVHRVTSVTTEPGGKGVNVARALTLAGRGRRGGAARPRHRSAGDRPAGQRGAVPLRADGRCGAHQPRDHRTRRHHNETQRAGRRPRRAPPSTRSPGPSSSARRVRRVGGAVRLPAARHARRLVRRRRRAARAVSVPGRHRHLRCVRSPRWSHRSTAAAPDLIKPNAEELAGVLGYSPQALEAAVAQGDPEPVVAAARRLVDRGVGAVLATLGAAGAVLVDETGSWMATPPPIAPRSTVGAGDASSPAISAPTSAAPTRRSGCRWPSPTAAPPPRCPAPRFPRPRRSTSMPFG